MKEIHKSYKFRIYPTKEQEVLMSKHFGCSRFVFNHFLSVRKEQYLNDKTSLNYYDNASSLTQLKKEGETEWLREVNSQSLQAAIRNLDTAYKSFFNKQNQFPKFKSKHNKQSFNVPQNVLIEEGVLMIPKFKKGIKAKTHREIHGKILFATISKNTTGKYYASVTCEESYEPLKKTGKSVGIDLGIKDFAILSDGKVYKNIKPLKTRLKKLKYNQRQLSKKEKGSESRNKQKQKLGVVYEKITNIRTDYLHKISTEIVKNHDIISVENLNVKGMMKNHKLAQAIADVSWSKFNAMLEYKSKWNNKEYVKIDRWFPSSKTCSSCGWINQSLELKHREWTCDGCGETHDRDINASKNILKQGLNIINCVSGTDSQSKQKRNEALPSGESVTSETQIVALGVTG